MKTYFIGGPLHGFTKEIENHSQRWYEVSNQNIFLEKYNCHVRLRHWYHYYNILGQHLYVKQELSIQDAFDLLVLQYLGSQIGDYPCIGGPQDGMLSFTCPLGYTRLSIVRDRFVNSTVSAESTLDILLRGIV